MSWTRTRTMGTACSMGIIVGTWSTECAGLPCDAYMEVACEACACALFGSRGWLADDGVCSLGRDGRHGGALCSSVATLLLLP